MSQTSEALKTISPGGFEQLASAVLRCAEPEYRRLIHTGINLAGQTVKSPLDGICSLLASHSPHFVIFHYTTTKRSGLKTKWLHKQTKRGKGSKTPDGDIVKAIRWTREQRQMEPSTRVRLVLACSEGPSPELIAEAAQTCFRHDIELDVWESSRFENFLENNADGQWLRKKYLGISQERLSIELLRELSIQSCFHYGRYEHLQDPDAWIARDLDERLHHQVWERGAAITLLVAGSGQGKTTASYKFLKRHADSGGIGLWIEPRFLGETATLDAVVEGALRSWCPTLEEGSGARAVELAATEGGLLVLIDDINRAPQPAELVRRIITLGKEGCQILCPVWPQVLDPLLERFREILEPLCIYVEGFSDKEGALAVERRAQVLGKSLSTIQAEELAGELANDPLLISLWGGGLDNDARVDGAPVAEAVIDEFIQRRLRSLSSNSIGMPPAAEIWEALIDLAKGMLLDRREIPSWRDVESWFQGKIHRLRVLQYLVGDRVICRLGDNINSALLFFRHDRVRDYLLARALRDWMNEGSLPDSLLSEPRYAEILGQALASATLQPLWANRAAKLNPLALACALRLLRVPQNSFQMALVENFKVWLQENVVSNMCVPSLRSAILWELRRTDSPLILDLSNAFCVPSLALWEAQARNGDVEAAARLCARIGAADHVQWVGYLARHVADRFGKAFLDDLMQLVERSDISDDLRRGALTLAGWLAEPSVLAALKASWSKLSIIKDCSLLSSFIWAVAQCAEGEPPPVLGEMIEAWGALSDEVRESVIESDRMSVAVDLQYAFTLGPPNDAVVVYFVSSAAREGMSRPIFVALSKMNHPSAVEFIVQHAAQEDRNADENGKHAASTMWSIADHWNSQESSLTRHLSAASVTRLREFWEPEDHNEFIRTRAFSLWITQAGLRDLEVLRGIEITSPLYKRALHKRRSLGDVSAISGVVEMLKRDQYPDGCWMNCEKIWCGELSVIFDRYLSELRDKLSKAWDFKGLYSTSAKLLKRIPENDAEELLCKHWPHLRYGCSFVQAALRIASRKSLAAVAEAISECPEPRRLLSHVHWGIGIQVKEEDAQVELRHLEALQPYLELLDGNAVKALWYFCNRRKLFSWRRRHLDPLLTLELRQRVGLEDDGLLLELDSFASQSIASIHIERWVERFEERGDSTDRVKNLLVRWLHERRSVEALRIAGICLAFVGSRSDLTILEAVGLLNEGPRVMEVIEDTRFAICRRTLD